MSRTRKFALGIGWGGVSVAVTTGFQLIFVAAMARLLEPADFGLVAVANVSLRFLSYFAQLGVAPALIQKSKIDRGDVAAALSVSSAISCFFGLLAMAMSPLAEHFFQMPRLGAIVRALAINFIISGLGAVSNGLIRREMRFKRLAMIDTAAYVVGYGLVGLTLAYSGFGVWSLVGAATAQALLSLMLSYAATRHSLSLRHTAAERRHFLAFGGRYSVIGFLEFLTLNIDGLLIARLFGPLSAGLYNRALLLANLPVQQPANVITRALFPLLSSASDQRQKQSFGFQVSILAIGGYACAVSGGIASAAPDIVAALLGPKWLESIPLLQILAFSVAPIFVSQVAGVSLDAMGELSIKLRIQLFQLALVIVLLSLLSSHGLRGVAAAIVLAETVRMVLMCRAVGKGLRVSGPEWSVIVMALACPALICSSAVFVVAHGLPRTVPTAGRLAAEIFAGVAGVLIAGLMVRKFVGRLSAVKDVARRTPFLARVLPI